VMQWTGLLLELNTPKLGAKQASFFSQIPCIRYFNIVIKKLIQGSREISSC
jgi:hypothetical protein